MAAQGSSKQVSAPCGKWDALRPEWLLLPGLISGVVFLLFGKTMVEDLSNLWWALVLFLWLTAMILIAAFGVVRHADCLAIKLGEPYGTLILTLSVIGMEVLMVTAVMLSGKGDPAMARDTMFAVLMIVLNGLVGVALLAGGLRHHEQQYNLQGAVSYLAMLVPLSATGLILPYYTLATSTPVLLKVRATALMLTTIGLYGAFVAVQTRRHPEHYHEPLNATLSDDATAAKEHMHPVVRSLLFHTSLLILYLLPVTVLSKKLAVILDYGGDRIGAPQAISGLVVAVLILCPEGVSAIQAALGNRLQRSVNLLFGAALSTIALTVPAVSAISLFTGRRVELGLAPVNQILLATTLIVSILTCATGRTNVMNGLIHLVIFLAYFVLIFGT
jgi:Ca2+:H+ antiporter